MDALPSKTVKGETAQQNCLSFWAFGDLHYRAREKWQAIHSRRLAPMFEDLKLLWQQEGFPDFAVSPGDIVHAGARENYRLAQDDLAKRLGKLPFYPGIGNHEYHRERAEDILHTAEEFSSTWGKPAYYSWKAKGVICIMLDHPNPYTYIDGEFHKNTQVILSPETLSFLNSTLQKYPDSPTLIFAHCPLYNTVLDRDPVLNLDSDSLDPFFFVKNSQEIRTILAQHPQVALYISGHTHSGWDSPNLIYTEILGDHPVTHVNLMSPWYTGRGHGPQRVPGPEKFVYVPDNPDMLLSFAFSIYPHYALIRVREHHTQHWMAQWHILLC